MECDEALLVRGGVVYPADAGNRVLHGGSVLIVGGVIEAVGPVEEVDALVAARPDLRVRQIRAEGFMVLPGLVNPHWHASLGLALRSVMPAQGSPWTDEYDQPGPMAYMGEVAQISMMMNNPPLPVGLDPEEERAFAEYSVWTQVRAGTTAFGDTGSSVGPAALAEATRTLGIRGRVSVWGADGFCEPGGVFRRSRPATEVVAAMRDELARAAQAPACDRVGHLATVAYAMSMSDELATRTADLAREHDLPFAIHVGAFDGENPLSKAVFGETPVRRLHRLGLLDERLLAIHPGFLDEEERNLVLDAGAHVNFSPGKYATAGESSYATSFAAWRAIGARISLSTDGLSLPVGGMIETMQAAWHVGNQTAADPTALRPGTLLRMVGPQAAAALGWGDRIGSLEVGRQGDLVMIAADDWRYLMRPRPLEGLLLAGGSNDVDTVVVAGEVVLRGGRSTRVDEAGLRRRFLDACYEVALRNGLGTEQIGWVGQAFAPSFPLP